MSDRSKSTPTVSLRLFVADADGVTAHDLPPRGSVVLGRASDAGVTIAHSSVSRRHAVLHLGDVTTVEDLGGLNGTFVNEVAVPSHGSRAVRHGDQLRLGEIVVVLQAPRAAKSGALELTEAVATRRGTEAERLERELHAADVPVIIRSAALRGVYETVEHIAASDVTVLVLGETGVGKELVARAVHARSPRAKKPFVEINGPALSEALLESELFGHTKGAFTGAHEAKAGILERAEGGTVFLDEVGELSLAIQAKLLRLLDGGKVQRVGSLESRVVDVRFVLATNRVLEREVAAGRFREDLFYRLNGVSVVVPPLRERREEIAPLADLFARSFSARLGRSRHLELAPSTLEALEAHAWPGNVRELKNAVERAVLLSGRGPIVPSHLQLSSREASPTTTVAAAPGDTERDRIVAALAKCAGNQSNAAKLLGISRSTLLRRITAYSLDRPRGPRRRAR